MTVLLNQRESFHTFAMFKFSLVGDDKGVALQRATRVVFLSCGVERPALYLAESCSQPLKNLFRLLQGRIVLPEIRRFVVNLLITLLSDIVADSSNQRFNLGRDTVSFCFEPASRAGQQNHDDDYKDKTATNKGPFSLRYFLRFILHPGAVILAHTSIQGVGSLGNERLISVSAGNNGARSCNATSADIFAR